uniref:Uncharacterized protein n=1 Tax=Arundo donax TaxID=35708 RepID=A0A0A9DHV3_ARUDO
MPWLVAALLLLCLCMLLWLVAAHVGVGVDGAHARGVEAGEAEDVAVREGAQPQEVPRHAVAGASPSPAAATFALFAAAAVGRGSCEPVLLGVQAREAEPKGGGAGHLGVVRAGAGAADGRAHLRRLLQQRRGGQVSRRRGQLVVLLRRRRWRRGGGRALRGGVAERLEQWVGVVVVGHRRRPRRHLRLHGVVAMLLLPLVLLLRLMVVLRPLHDFLVVVVLLERGELLVVLHRLQRRRREEQRVVRRRGGGHGGVEADGLGALLGERVAEGAVRDEAVPPACDPIKQKGKIRSLASCCSAAAPQRIRIQNQKGKEKATVKEKNFLPFDLVHLSLLLCYPILPCVTGVV